MDGYFFRFYSLFCSINCNTDFFFSVKLDTLTYAKSRRNGTFYAPIKRNRRRKSNINCGKMCVCARSFGKWNCILALKIAIHTQTHTLNDAGWMLPNQPATGSSINLLLFSEMPILHHFYAIVHMQANQHWFLLHFSVQLHSQLQLLLQWNDRTNDSFGKMSKIVKLCYPLSAHTHIFIGCLFCTGEPAIELFLFYKTTRNMFI